jgi:aryl-phospho-beta-D-glucosidase BglC (GH1 family)
MDILRLNGNLIVDRQARPVRLRGFGVGGWMNTEHFINGYPGFESRLRETTAEVLGKDRADFLFERMLDYFLAEPDIAMMKQLGATVVRFALNYRHFESDAEPFKYLERGFARLDRAIQWCAKHGLYVILDLHAAQGWQDPDWHSDHYGRLCLLWRHRQFQDRFVGLWEEFARRYRDSPAVAGYNILNEPVTGAPYGFFGFKYQPDWKPLNDLYIRTVAAIRRIDPEHIIFLEGDFFSTLFSGLDAPFATNLVYSSHSYIKPCFDSGAYPGRFVTGSWDANRMKHDFMEQEGTQFARKHNVPLWVGEFGGAFDGPAEELPMRLQAVDDQIAAFEDVGSHWTIWTWKDVGMMGLATTAPESEYMKLLEPILKLKAELGTDSWGTALKPTEVRTRTSELAALVLKILPNTGVDPERFKFYFEQTALAGFVGAFIQPLWARCFRDMTQDDIDRVMQSFRLDNCPINSGLSAVLRKHTAGASGPMNRNRG